MAQDPIDPVVALLVKSPLSPSQRRSASEAFTSSANEDELAEKLTGLKLPRNVSAGLWDLKVSRPAQANTEPSATPPGSAVGRFVGGVAEQLNPVTIAEGIYNTVRHPIDTASGILSAANDQRMKAHEAFDRGEWGQGAAHSVAAAIPILGPAAADAGEQIASGDVAGGLGKATGIVAPIVATGAMGKSPVKNTVKADALEREAVQQVAQKVLAPKNPKYQPLAQDAAKELLKRGVQGDRVAVQQWAEDLISDAGQRIDDIAEKYPADQKLPTKPLLNELDSEMAQYVFGGPGGVRRVNPSFRDVYDELGKWRDFIAERGDEMSFGDLKRFRQQLDSSSAESGSFAKAKGDKALSASEKAEKFAANAARRSLAEGRPELSGPNADMHLGIAVRDILDPVKGRPANAPSATTGATGGLHTTGAIIGSSAAKVLDKVPIMQPIAAYVASEVIPKLREAQVSPQNQLRLAQDKYKLAQALKAGQAGKAQGILRTISSYVPALTGIGRITEPSGAPQ